MRFPILGAKYYPTTAAAQGDSGIKHADRNLWKKFDGSGSPRRQSLMFACKMAVFTV
jgi:hypothetical protein